ncbi:uncharacterized protein TNCV_2502831 [Trichonephila clavipes]|nr:uncharacterized protein TNCV_2502831 [Trichonephila clavipes]
MSLKTFKITFSFSEASLGQDIQSAYITWQKLPSSIKWEMDRQLQKSLRNISQKQLYESLIRSFDIWDQTQDNDGAPGWCIKESSLNEVVKHVGEDLLSLLHTLEEIWENHKKEIFKTRVETEERIANFSPDSLDKDGEENISADSSQLMNSFHEKENTEGNEKSGKTLGANPNENSPLLSSTSDQNDSEIFKKVRFEGNFEKLSSVDDDANLLKDSRVSYEHLEDQFETSNPSTSRLEDLMDLSLEEDIHLKNLRINDCQEDSDFEKQISPLLSDDDD